LANQSQYRNDSAGATASESLLVDWLAASSQWQVSW
jgi:hypothetical protein